MSSFGKTRKPENNPQCSLKRGKLIENEIESLEKKIIVINRKNIHIHMSVLLSLKINTAGLINKEIQNK